MIVVLDTNVVISALLFGGRTGPFRELWTKHAIKPIANREMLHEYARVLAYKKFKLDAEEISLLLDEEVFAYFTIVRTSSRKLPSVPKDHTDTIFLRAGIDGHAAFLVTGDAHLQALDGAYPFPIVTPGRFLENHPGL
jgi:putative PIN family toxin of toxin-antitoxin system